MNDLGRDLVLAHLTLPHLLPPDFISMAAETGFQGVSLRLIPASPPEEEQLPMFGSSPLLARTLEQIEATGVYVNDIEVPKIEPDIDLGALERVLETAARLQARFLTVVALDDVEERVADRLAAVAELSASYGLRTALECMAFMGIKTLAQGARVIDLSGRSEVGLIIDPLHLDRAGDSPANIAMLPPERIAWVQLCDAGARPDVTDIEALIDEARGNRLVPGTGTLPLSAVMAAVPGHVPVSLEVPTRGMIGSIPDAEIATMMRDAAVKLLVDH